MQSNDAPIVFAGLVNEFNQTEIDHFRADLTAYCSRLASPITVIFARDRLDELQKPLPMCRALIVLASQVRLRTVADLITRTRPSGCPIVVLQNLRRKGPPQASLAIPFRDQGIVGNSGGALRALIDHGLLPDEHQAYVSSLVLMSSPVQRPTEWFAGRIRWRQRGQHNLITLFKQFDIPVLLFAGGVLMISLIARWTDSPIIPLPSLSIWGGLALAGLVLSHLVALLAPRFTPGHMLDLIAGPEDYLVGDADVIKRGAYRLIQSLAVVSRASAFVLDITDTEGTLQRIALPSHEPLAAAFVQRLQVAWQIQRGGVPQVMPLSTAGTTAPLMLWFVAADRHVGEQLLARLRARGLTVVVADPDAASFSPCQVCLPVITRASMRAPQLEAVTAWMQERGVPLIPLAFVTHRTLPARLHAYQWVDFSGRWDAGWRALMLALTTYDRRVAAFDADAILERYQRGMVPTDWRVFRTSLAGSSVGFEDGLTMFAGVMLTLTLIVGFATLFVSTLAPITSWDVLFRLAAEPLQLLLWFTLTLLLFLFIPVVQAQTSRILTILTPLGVVQQRWRRRDAFTFDQIVGIQVATAEKEGQHQERDPAQQYSVFVARDGKRYPITNDALRYAFERYLAGRANELHSPAPPVQEGRLLFISHARADAPLIDRVDRDLQEGGVETWIDRRRLQGGQAWAAELEAAIAACAALLVVITPHALASVAVRQEYTQALALGKTVIAWIARPVAPEQIPAELRARLSAPPGPTSILVLLARCNDLGFGPDCFDPTAVAANPMICQHVLDARLAANALPAGACVFRGRVAPFALALIRTLIIVLASIVGLCGFAVVVHLGGNLFWSLGCWTVGITLYALTVPIRQMGALGIAVVAPHGWLAYTPRRGQLAIHPFRGGLDPVLRFKQGGAIKNDLSRFGDADALMAAITAAHARYSESLRQ